MTTPSLTRLCGYIAPCATPPKNCRMSLITDSGEEYPVLTKCAGADFVDMVSIQVEAVCVLSPLENEEQEEKTEALLVRSYKILDTEEEAL